MIRLEVVCANPVLATAPVALKLYKSNGTTNWYKLTDANGVSMHTGKRNHIRRMVRRHGLKCKALSMR